MNELWIKLNTIKQAYTCGVNQINIIIKTVIIYIHISYYIFRIQFNSEEQWTKALKFMLTNLKWGLAWVSSQFANK